jgi:hypothetical protein
MAIDTRRGSSSVIVVLVTGINNQHGAAIDPRDEHGMTA